MFGVGTPVRKTVGEKDKGLRGRIEEILVNAKGETILSVRTIELYGNRHAVAEPWAQSNMGGTATRVRHWLADECEVISESW